MMKNLHVAIWVLGLHPHSSKHLNWWERTQNVTHFDTLVQSWSLQYILYSCPICLPFFLPLVVSAAVTIYSSIMSNDESLRPLHKTQMQKDYLHKDYLHNFEQKMCHYQPFEEKVDWFKPTFVAFEDFMVQYLVFVWCFLGIKFTPVDTNLENN